MARELEYPYPNIFRSSNSAGRLAVLPRESDVRLSILSQIGNPDACPELVDHAQFVDSQPSIQIRSSRLFFIHRLLEWNPIPLDRAREELMGVFEAAQVSFAQDPDLIDKAIDSYSRVLDGSDWAEKLAENPIVWGSTKKELSERIPEKLTYADVLSDYSRISAEIGLSVEVVEDVIRQLKRDIKDKRVHLMPDHLLLYAREAVYTVPSTSHRRALKMRLQGYSNSQIAAELGIAERSVATYLVAAVSFARSKFQDLGFIELADLHNHNLYSPAQRGYLKRKKFVKAIFVTAEALRLYQDADLKGRQPVPSQELLDKGYVPLYGLVPDADYKVLTDRRGKKYVKRDSNGRVLILPAKLQQYYADRKREEAEEEELKKRLKEEGLVEIRFLKAAEAIELKRNHRGSLKVIKRNTYVSEKLLNDLRESGLGAQRDTEPASPGYRILLQDYNFSEFMALVMGIKRGLVRKDPTKKVSHVNAEDAAKYLKATRKR